MGQSKVGNRLYAAKSQLSRFKRGKRHKHQELSGVDEDELDDEDEIELGNDDDRRTRAQQNTRKNRTVGAEDLTPKPYHNAIRNGNGAAHQIGDDSATSSSEEVIGI